MKLQIFILLALISIVFACCRKKKDDLVIHCENCLNLSNLGNKQNYTMPQTLYNDLENSEINSILWNGAEIEFSYGDTLNIMESGFHELVIVYNENTSRLNDTILFTTITPERESAEWGIKAWVPAMFKTTVITSEDIEFIAPRRYTSGIHIPAILYIKETGLRKPVYMEVNSLVSEDQFYIKRGVGSVNMDASNITNMLGFDIGSKEVQYAVTKIENPDLVLEGDVESDLTLPANSLVHVINDLHILPGVSLTIEEGVVLIINEAVNITNDGPVTFSGTQINPILVTCSNKDTFWGGFISYTSNSSIEAGYTIFCQSGYHNTAEYNWGHAKRQALFGWKNCTITLHHCYMTDHIGQVFYPDGATLIADNILVQRVKTGGQITSSTATITNSVFTDFPDDSQIYRDEDNDALYVAHSDVTINNSVFMFAKDDGLDAGSSEYGTVSVSDSHFEACFHEGAALSGHGSIPKNQTFTNCSFSNCGQGIELGFSIIGHTVMVDNCSFLNNYIGIRYGDNYAWSNCLGVMTVKNSESLNNEKDVWNMVRSTWEPSLDNLKFENTAVSKYLPQYPNLVVIEQ